MIIGDGAVTLHKLHGTGSAYLVANAVYLGGTDPSALARSACRRRTGLDADGLARVAHQSQRLFLVHVWNADGSVSRLNGNALRCCARCIRDEYGYRSMQLRQDGMRCLVEVDGERVRIRLSAPAPPSRLTSVGPWDLFRCEVGTPHLVAIGSDVDGLRDPTVFADVDRDSAAYLTTVCRVGESVVRIRTFETGMATETLSSANGAVAAVMVCRLRGLVTTAEVVVGSAGGELRVQPDGPDQYWVDGPVHHVLTGNYVWRARP